MTKSSYKKRYIIFVLTVIITIISNEVILQYKLNLQKSDAKVINLAGRQRMLSQRIAKYLLYLGNKTQHLGHANSNDSLKTLLQEFEHAHLFLKQNKLTNTETSERLMKLDPLISGIITNGKLVVQNPSDENIKGAISNLSKFELPFLLGMEDIVVIYQKEAEKKLANTTNIALILSVFSILIVLGEFIFIIIPFFNELFQKNKALETANRRLSDFAYITSHNLRAPISNLNSLLFLINNANDEVEKNDLLTKFETVIQNLNVTMNTLVEALKTQNQEEYELEPIQLEDILNKTVENLSAKVLNTNAVIHHNFSELESVDYDKVYLESIFQNLIGNSLKYHSPERNPDIAILSKKINGKAQLIFQDNGLGIDLKRHGEKLFGLNKTFHRHPEAKGVGLFMTRTQIEALGGTITAESKVNQGTCFTVTL